MKITQHIDEAIKEYTKLREQYEKLGEESVDNYTYHDDKRDTTEDFSQWFDESIRLGNIRGYYDMIIAEIDQAICALRKLQHTKNHIEIYQKRVDKLNEV